MKVKVYEHGAESYQLAHLDDAGKIKNVRPATKEEFHLYQTLKTQMELLQAAYGLKKELQDKLKRAIAERDERLTLEESSRLAKKVDELREDLDQMRIRAEAAEAALVEDGPRIVLRPGDAVQSLSFENGKQVPDGR